MNRVIGVLKKGLITVLGICLYLPYIGFHSFILGPLLTAVLIPGVLFFLLSITGRSGVKALWQAVIPARDVSSLAPSTQPTGRRG